MKVTKCGFCGKASDVVNMNHVSDISLFEWICSWEAGRWKKKEMCNECYDKVLIWVGILSVTIFIIIACMILKGGE